MSVLTGERKTKKQYPGEDDPILSVNLTTPVFGGEHTALAHRTARYYDTLHDSLFSFAEKKLYRKALKRQKEHPQEKNAPWSLVLSCRKSFEDETYVSVFCDAFVYDGLRQSGTARIAQVWRIEDGELLPLSHFLPLDRSILVSAAVASARTLTAQGVNSFYEDAESRISRFFNPLNYYLTPNGVAVFFAAGTLNDLPLPSVFLLREKNLGNNTKK